MTFCKWAGDCDVLAYSALSGHFTVLTALDLPKLGGQSFHEKTLADLAERLKLLREAGLKVPQAALAAVEAEHRRQNRAMAGETEDYK